MNNLEINKLRQKYNLNEDYIKENVKCLHSEEQCGCREKKSAYTYFDIARNRYLNITV